MKLNEKTKKKMLSAIILLVIIILGYFNYFKEETVKKDENKKIETSLVEYSNEDYKIEATEQTDDLAKKETTFKKAKAYIKGMILSSENVFLDKAKNLILDSKISGISENGWEFDTTKLNYDSKTGTIYSDERVEAKNEKDNLNMAADTFKSDTKMSYIKLSGNVELKNEKVKVTGQEAIYVDKTKNVVLSGEVKGQQFGITNPYNFMGKRLLYNSKDKSVVLSGQASIYQDNKKINAEVITYNPARKSVKIDGEYNFITEDYNGNGNNIFIDNVSGEVKGGDIFVVSQAGDKIQANSILGNINKLYIDLKDNVKGSRIESARNVEYSSDVAKILLVKKNNKNDIKSITLSKNAKLNVVDKIKGSMSAEANEIIYVMATREVFLKGNVITKSKDEKGETTITGQEGKAILDENTFEVVGKVVVDSPEVNIKADKVIYNSETKKIKSYGAVTVDYKIKVKEQK